MNPRGYIVDDLLNERNMDLLFSALFKYDDRVDVGEIFNLLKRRFDEYRNNISEEEAEVIENLINTIRNSKKEQEILLTSLRDKLLEGLDVNEFEQLDGTLFWHFYALAIKRCLSTPKATLDIADYYETLKLIGIVDLTKDLRKAHEQCVESFGYDLLKIKGLPQKLSLFSPKIRSGKRNRTKKKHIHWTVKKTQKVIQARKLYHTNTKEYIFSKGRHLVPEQFAKAVIKTFLSD